jgi:hypothetical protein
MRDDCTGVELLIEEVLQERIVPYPGLNRLTHLLKDTLGCIYKDLVQMLLVTYLVKKRIETLDADQLGLRMDEIVEIEKAFEIPKGNR